MENCIFCQIAKKESPAQIVYEDARYMAFLDIHPQSRGHLQLIPKKHYRWLYELPDIGSFFECAQEIIRVIIPALEADHVTLAAFGREVAHAHLWIVPQYRRSVRLKEGQKQTAATAQDVVKILQKALNSRLKNQNVA